MVTEEARKDLEHFLPHLEVIMTALSLRALIESGTPENIVSKVGEHVP